MTLLKMLSIWFYGDISKKFSLKNAFVQRCEAGKGWKTNLPDMKNLVNHVMRSALIANWNDLVVNCWYPRKVMELYGGV